MAYLSFCTALRQRPSSDVKQLVAEETAVLATGSLQPDSSCRFCHAMTCSQLPRQVLLYSAALGTLQAHSAFCLDFPRTARLSAG